MGRLAPVARPEDRRGGLLEDLLEDPLGDPLGDRPARLEVVSVPAVHRVADRPGKLVEDHHRGARTAV